jgi:hypothetical protein
MQNIDHDWIFQVFAGKLDGRDAWPRGTAHQQCCPHKDDQVFHIINFSCIAGPGITFPFGKHLPTALLVKPARPFYGFSIQIIKILYIFPLLIHEEGHNL